ncbi:MAG TPA: hypothetical protein VND43_07820 [Burkholderiales bacterium]|nr:hypothetical protein [Burkholderiales bacterium]
MPLKQEHQSQSLNQHNSSVSMITVLDHLGVLVFSDQDAQKFLHSQLTCDVAGLSKDHATPGGYLTAKGRLLCTFMLWRMGDEFMMQLPKSLLEPVMAHFKKFVLRDKVGIRNASDEISCYGLIKAEPLLAKDFCFPSVNHTLCSFKNISILRLTHERAEIIGNQVTTKDIQPVMDNMVKVGSNIWRKMDIERGWPVILPETQGLFVPQMVNLEKSGGISFKKGCYPGQEIVARMQYRGTPGRIMYRISAVEGIAKPGDPVMKHDSQIGHVVNAEPEALGYTALAVLPVDTRISGLKINDKYINTLKIIDEFTLQD